MRVAHKIKIALILFSILDLSVACSYFDDDDESSETATMSRLVVIPAELSDNSGIILYDSLIWTINDSGNEPVLYAVDTATGYIVRRVELSDAQNTDWEEIAQDENHIYIGDFGNNDGNRTDLRIYKINKSDLSENVITPEIIHFSYEDQTDFTPAYYDNPYDCESMICTEDTIFLFTKNWTGDYSSSVYKFPAGPGNYQAVHCGKLNTDGQVTASVYSVSDSRLYLLGYKNYLPFISVFEGYIPGESFEGNARQYIFSDKLGLQTEGITLTEDGRIIISAEKGIAAPALYQVILGN
ncbi:MAG: hypothetical protein JXR41_04930 [Bacteroidales bacterium]|nr:hypothetical protein [Bacteroidales bacterium]MBN2762415.1 hypothetical protein [Bacteroidales bacterium]